MLTINAQKNQSLIDLSIQLYGTEEAAFQLYAWNANKWESTNPSIDAAVPEGMQIEYDPAYSLKNKEVLKNLNYKTITTYGTI